MNLINRTASILSDHTKNSNRFSENTGTRKSRMPLLDSMSKPAALATIALAVMLTAHQSAGQSAGQSAVQSTVDSKKSEASLNGRGFQQLDQETFLIQSARERAYNAPINVSVNWISNETNRSGSFVSVQQASMQNGTVCKQVKQVLRIEGVQPITMLEQACKNVSGNWQIQENKEDHQQEASLNNFR